MKNRGFTLIELVIVIVLLGILAATALPKFANLTDQARTAAVQGVAGALGSAVSIAHSQWLASGQPATIILEGTTFAMTAEGWPEGAPTVGTSGTSTAAKCQEVFANILSNPPASASGTCTGSCEYLVSTTSPVCTYTAQQGSGAVINYDITTGAVTIS